MKAIMVLIFLGSSPFQSTIPFKDLITCDLALDKITAKWIATFPIRQPIIVCVET